MNRRLQEGVAVLVAILLIALAAAAAAFIQAEQTLWDRQVQNLAARMQADALARAGVQWMQLALADKDGPPPRAEELAARALDAMKLEDAALRMDVTDQQGLFNLNNVVRGEHASEADVQLLRRLLGLLGLAPQLAGAVLDAVDPDSETTLPGGAEDLDYLAMDPPRRAPNRQFLDPAGIARLRGFDPQSAARLEPYVAALPSVTAINVNSAPVELLAALVPQLGLEAARALVAQRAARPFESVADFRARLPQEAQPAPGISIDVRSRYFLVEAEARAARAEAVQRVLLGSEGTRPPTALWRKQGGE